MKGDGSAVGLTNNPAALKMWVTADPEIACLVISFQHQLLLSQDRLKDHHEQIPFVQNAFTRDVDVLVSAFEEAGNPFEDDGECLFALGTKKKYLLPQSRMCFVKENSDSMTSPQTD